MSRGSCPCGAPCIVFYDVWRLLGAPDSNDRVYGVGPLKKLFARLRRFGSGECLEDLGSGKLNVSYSTVSGGSWEVQFLTKLVYRVGPPKETKDRIFGSSDLRIFDLRIFGSSDLRMIFGSSDLQGLVVWSSKFGGYP